MLKSLYNELAGILSAVEGVRWVDLWHEQVGFLAEEHPFPAPALFLGFQSLGMESYPGGVQVIPTQVDVYVFHETFADSYAGSANQTNALAFMEMVDAVQAALHGRDGQHFKTLERIAYQRMESGGSGILYRISYSCHLVDAGAVGETSVEEYVDVRVRKG